MKVYWYDDDGEHESHQSVGELCAEGNQALAIIIDSLIEKSILSVDDVNRMLHPIFYVKESFL